MGVSGRLKKDNLSLHFVPVESEVFPNSLSIEITGDLMGYNRPYGKRQFLSH
jgi:hypothetical protein